MDSDELLAELENAVQDVEPEWQNRAHQFVVENFGMDDGLNALPLPFRLSFVVMFAFLVRSVNVHHTFGIDEATKHMTTAFLALYFANHIMKKDLLPGSAPVTRRPDAPAERAVPDEIAPDTLPDIEIRGYGTVYLLRPMTAAAKAWVNSNGVGELAQFRGCDRCRSAGGLRYRRCGHGRWAGGAAEGVTMMCARGM